MPRSALITLAALAACGAATDSTSGAPTNAGAPPAVAPTASADPLAVDMGSTDPLQCIMWAPFDLQWPDAKATGWADHAYRDGATSAHGPVTVLEHTDTGDYTTLTLIGEWSCAIDAAGIAHFTLLTRPHVTVADGDAHRDDTADPRGWAWQK